MSGLLSATVALLYTVVPMKKSGAAVPIRFIIKGQCKTHQTFLWNEKILFTICYQLNVPNGTKENQSYPMLFMNPIPLVNMNDTVS
ncbi:hypothetical protein QF042_001075 [Pedobacter sp. W3I1]|nr:hypothetical protein [Pedobacter sp. W3I1]